MKHIFFLLLLFAFLRVGTFYLFPLQLRDGEKVKFSATLFEDPQISGSRQEFSLRFGTFWQSREVSIRTTDETPYQYGQEMEVSGIAKETLLKNKQTIMTIQNTQIKAKNNGVLPFFGSLRQKIIIFCENNFSQPYSGLLVGIIFGVKSSLTEGVTRSFRITGLSHVVAASGMNVTLVAGFLIALFGSFLRRQEAIVVSIVGIFLYVCVSGFEASIVRAALMGTIAFSAGLFGRQYSSLYVLCLVGLIMLVWDPMLVANVGFQLSILATAGILVLKPAFFHWKFLGDDIGTTLSAQVATVPVILSVFGQYSFISLLVNVLVLWTIPLIMTVGGVGIIVGLFLEPIGKLIVSLIIPLLWYMDSVVKYFSASSVVWKVQDIPFFFIAGYYCFLGAFLFLKKSVSHDGEGMVQKHVN